MTLNLDEMDKVLREATALVAMLYKAVDKDSNGKIGDYISKRRAEDLMRELSQVGEQIRMLRDMFYPTLPDNED